MAWFFGSEAFWLICFVCAVAITVLYEKSPVFRYRLKFAVYIFVVSTVALGMLPFCLFRPKDVRNILIGVPFVRPVNKLLGIRWEISGKEILKKDFPCIVVCNHQSMLDILAVIELWPTMKKCACIAKKEIFYVFPFGLMAWLCGTVYINRHNSSQSQMTISTSAEKIRQDKTKMWIFPEGTRTKKQTLSTFKKGAFHIAAINKLPIVPVVVSPYTFIDDEKKTFDSGTMKVRILPPIETSDLQYPEDLTKLVENCHDLMEKEFQKLRNEVETTSVNTSFDEMGNNNGSLANDRSSKANGRTNGHIHTKAAHEISFEEGRSS